MTLTEQQLEFNDSYTSATFRLRHAILRSHRESPGSTAKMWGSAGWGEEMGAEKPE